MLKSTHHHHPDLRHLSAYSERQQPEMSMSDADLGLAIPRSEIYTISYVHAATYHSMLLPVSARCLSLK